MNNAKRLSPIQEWLHTPPNQRIPLSWVKRADGSWALVPTCQAETYKKQEELRYRLEGAFAFAFQVAGLICLILLPVTAIILYFFR